MKPVALSVFSPFTSLKSGSETFLKTFLLAIILLATTVKCKSGCSYIYLSVSKGEKVTLHNDLEVKINPPLNYFKWSRLKDNKSVLIGLGERKTGSSWKWSVADDDKFALTNNGLEIKHMDEGLEKYILSFQNAIFVCYAVHVPPPVISVVFFNVTKFKKVPIPNGVMFKYVIEIKPSTGLENDCRKRTVLLCRKSKKVDANIARCEVGEDIKIFSVESCKFPVEYNVTMNDTISGNFHLYLEFPVSDPSYGHKRQLFSLPTKVISTDPPATTTRSDNSETTTTTSLPNSTTQATITTPKSPTTSTKQATYSTAKTTRRYVFSEPTVAPNNSLKSPVSPTKEFVGTNSAGCLSTSDNFWKVFGAISSIIVCLALAFALVYYFCFRTRPIRRSNQYELSSNDVVEEDVDMLDIQAKS